MEEFSRVIEQDLKAIQSAFDSDDFHSMNVFANRIMANATFLSEGRLFGLIGYLLKDIALDYHISLRGKSASTLVSAKTHGKDYLNWITKALEKKDITEDQLWERYYKYMCDIRTFMQDQHEQVAYTEENLPFVRHSYKWLIQFLNEEKECLMNPKNMLLGGILSEINRIYKVHGWQLYDAYTYLLIQMLRRFYEYLHYESTSEEGEFNSKLIEKRLFPYLDRINKALSNDKDVNVSEVNSILWDLIVEWRIQYIRFMELPRQVVSKGVEIPEELREKLSESITEALETEKQ
jgi:hypothetical protein